MQRNAVRRSLTRTQRALSIALLLAIGALVFLHAMLLWQRLDDRTIARPDVAIRWIAGAAIAIAAFLLRRATARSRVWVVFWIAVAILHLCGPAGAVLTQAVIAATPLLLPLVVATMCAASSDSLLDFAHRSEATREPAFALAGDRAPPR